MIIEKKIAQIALTTALQTAYTVPANTRLYIKTFDLCNTSKLTIRSATVHFVKATASAGVGNMIVPDVDLEPKSMLQWTGLQILDSGDTIQIVASGPDITLNMSGAESTF